MLQDITDAETGQRGYLLTSDQRYLEPYHAAIQRLSADRAELRAQLGNDPVQLRQSDSLSRRIDDKTTELAQTIELMHTKGFDAARAAVDTHLGQRVMVDIRGLLHQIADRQQRRLDERMIDSDRRYRLLGVIVVAGTLALIVIALMLNTVLTRYGHSQADAARLLDSQNAELVDSNRRLSDQAAELELQNQQLQEQATEMEAQQTQLQEQATEMEAQAAELEVTVNELQELSAVAEKARESAEEASTRAEEANRAKSLFLTTMSHELRTPLNAIAGYVDLLALEIRGPLVDAQREDLRRIKRSGQHLLSLINDILNLAKIESGQLDLEITDVPIVTVIESVDMLVQPQFNTKGISYVLPKCDPSLTVRADREKLQQILLNVLSNACKFTDEGGVVTLECDPNVEGDGPDRSMVAITVHDTGRGIAQGKLEMIFEPFVQIDRHLTGASQQGVGLGLAISRDLARSMSGDLVARSTVGEGTTFTLTIPRAEGAKMPPGESALLDSTDPITAS